MNKNKLIWSQDEMPQGSPEWHQFYGRTLGGSETACLMFTAYGKTIDSLWEEKVAFNRGVQNVKVFKPEHQAIIDRGTRLEPLARSTYEKKYRCKVDQMCMTHKDLPYLRTSLDGISRNRKVVQEFKCPKDADNHARFTKDGLMPTWRFPQVQHQLGVTLSHFPKVERVDYISFLVAEDADGNVTETDMIRIKVIPDFKYITELFRRTEIFMEHYVKKEIRPPVDIFREGHKLIARVKKLQRPTNGVDGSYYL